jgi:predicted transcriptional regulator
MADHEPMQPVMVRMPEELYSEVKRLANEDDRSISWTIRRAVTQYVAATRSPASEAGPDERCLEDDEPCTHERFSFSTRPSDPMALLECQDCGAFGSVPLGQRWSDATWREPRHDR